jgi:hypothetical protein
MSTKSVGVIVLGDDQKSVLLLKKTQVLPWWYISLLRVGFFFRNMRNHVLGRS